MNRTMTASATLDERFRAKFINDGVATPVVHMYGYGAFPDNTPGWVRV